jgi:hypothetical protein
MEQEIWKDIPNYEGMYQVSNLGRVKSLPRKRKGNGDSTCMVSERILKGKIDKYGYLVFALSKNAKMHHFTSHKLVCIAFSPNPNPEVFNQINHKDGNKLNNRIDNLEWCDAKHNNQEALRIGLRGGKPYNPRTDSSPINQYGLNGDFIKRYDNLAQASRETGIKNTAIGNCLGGRSKSSGGFRWSFAK